MEEDLNPEELYFLQTMFPHLMQSGVSDSPQGRIYASPQGRLPASPQGQLTSQPLIPTTPMRGSVAPMWRQGHSPVSQSSTPTSARRGSFAPMWRQDQSPTIQPPTLTTPRRGSIAPMWRQGQSPTSQPSTPTVPRRSLVAPMWRQGQSPTSQPPTPTTPRRGSVAHMWRSSSPIDITQASSMNPPDWGPAIAADYEDPMLQPQPRSPRRPKSLQNSQISKYSDRSGDKNVSDYYRGQTTEEFSWNVRDRPELRFDLEEESLLRQFDRGVRAELVKRRRAYSTSLSGVRRAADESERTRPRDMSLAAQADNLAKAEALALFAEAVEAAEKATHQSEPEFAERDAARAYEARLVEAVASEGTAGSTPIEVVAYVGVTHPKNPQPQRH